MRGEEKKTRADNFSEEDKFLLLSLIANHVSVLECRKTDHKNNSAKYKAWASISKKFHRKASHPRNFTQMKDLYRRLKLKARKEVGMWLKACAESGTGAPLPGSHVIRPDDTSFLVYDMIKPYKEELSLESEEQERLLAEAVKNSELNESTSKDDDDDNVLVGPPTHKDIDNIERDYSEEEAASKTAIKEEPDFEYIPPHVIEAAAEEQVETTEMPARPRPERASAISAKRHIENQRDSPSPVLTSSLHRPHKSPSRQWQQPPPKRRRTFPSLDVRHGSIPPRPNRFVSAFTSRKTSWGDINSSFSREPPVERDADEDVTEGMSPYEEGLFQMAQAEHKAKMLVLQTQRRAETAKEEAYKMIWQNAQLQRDLLQLQYENVL